MSVPVKRTEDAPEILYVRGVFASNVRYLKTIYKKQGYTTLGAFMNDLVKDIRKATRNR